MSSLDEVQGPLGTSDTALLSVRLLDCTQNHLRPWICRCRLVVTIQSLSVDDRPSFQAARRGNRAPMWMMWFQTFRSLYQTHRRSARYKSGRAFLGTLGYGKSPSHPSRLNNQCIEMFAAVMNQPLFSLHLSILIWI